LFGFLKNKFLWLIFLVIILLLFLINATSPNREDITVIEKLVRDSYTPLQNGIHKLRTGWVGVTAVFSEKKVLNKQIEMLDRENDRLKLQNQALREYEAEVQRLRNLLEFKNFNTGTYELIAAQVIARSPSNWYELIIINKGSRDGIKEGMPVITPDGLVGRVGSTSENSAQVNLITDRQIAVGAILQRTRETNGIVEGQGSSSILKMINIPYYAAVEKNDKVITSGLSQIYPKGIDIGTVSEVEKEPNGLLLSASVTPAVDFDKLEEVLVVQNYYPIDTTGEEE